MQEFIAERNNGTVTTTAVDQALMKTFKDASAIDLAIQAGIVNEGEIVSTIEDDKPHTLPIDQLRDLQEDVRKLQEEHGGSITESEVDTKISNAVSSLDAASVGGNGKYIKAISEADGVISAIEEIFDTTVTQNSSVGVTSGAVYTAIDDEAIARANADTALDGRLDTLEADPVTKTYVDGEVSTISTSISGVDSKISTNATSSDRCPAASEVASSISTAVGNEATARGTAITNAINALDVAASGGTGKFIKAISQTDGKISATEGTLSMRLSGNDLYITFA